MPADLAYARQARDDLADAHSFYEGRQVGLGERFLAVVQARADRLRAVPKMHAVVYRHYRRAVLKGFPYVLIYSFDEAVNRVVIHSVFHTSQHPDSWKSRVD